MKLLPWIIFGSVIGSLDVFRLQKEPINSFRSYILDRSIYLGFSAWCRNLCIQGCASVIRLCVCVFNTISRKLRNRFFETFTKLYLDETKKCSKRILKKILRIIGDYCQKWAKNQHFLSYLPNARFWSNLIKSFVKLVWHHMA